MADVMIGWRTSSPATPAWGEVEIKAAKLHYFVVTFLRYRIFVRKHDDGLWHTEFAKPGGVGQDQGRVTLAPPLPNTRDPEAAKAAAVERYNQETRNG